MMRVKTSLPELDLTSEKYTERSEVVDPRGEHFKKEVFQNNVFLLIDPAITGVRSEAIKNLFRARDKRSSERKLVEKITVKDQVNNLVRYFEENHLMIGAK